MPSRSYGFTLIELSIVLIIIGLITGGILVGRDLIAAATLRAQVAQIEKFNTAVNTFYGKYDGLPGDLNPALAQQNGFVARGSAAGEGDGNGYIEGSAGVNPPLGINELSGEAPMFWSDLTYANGMNLSLIPGSFVLTTFPINNWNGSVSLSGSQLDAALPAAKIGGGNYIYVWSGAGVNYYSMSKGIHIYNSDFAGELDSTPGLSVIQAYNIDVKMDDGQPYMGRVLSAFLNDGITWGDNTGSTTAPNALNVVPTGPRAPSATTCVDDNGNAGSPWTYSLSQNGGNGINCGLTFRFQ